MKRLYGVSSHYSVIIDRRLLMMTVGLNARMRRIDLICKLVGPLFIALVDGGSTTVAIWITASLSAVSLPIEYFTIAKVRISSKHE